MDIQGVDQALVSKLYRANLLKTPADFYSLASQKRALFRLEGLQRKSINNLLTNIEKSKKTPFACLVNALGIPLLGKVKAEKLATVCSNLASLLSASKDFASLAKLLGEKTQKSIVDYLVQTRNYQELERLSEINFSNS